MALVVKDRVKQTTTTTGTGNIVLNGTVDGFQTFAAVLSNGDTTYYSIFVPSTNAFEVGLGTWTESTATLARTTVLESSNSGNAINITAQAEVFITYPAEKSVYLDSSNNVTLSNNLTVTGDFTVSGTTTTIDTTNSVITDSLIELGNGTSGSPTNDAGIVIERGSSDNAFIGYDESADKFTVGTGSFTGASTGNLTISTGTLVANVEGNVTGNVTGNVSGSSGSTTGNAATATALATARNIGGVSFDGTANINLPGVNTAGNQNTSGNAATATILETARTIGGVSFNGSANINLPGVNTSGNQDTSGNAATATTAGTVTTAAQPNITSLGTLTTLTVDDITIDGSNIVFEGATADDFETTVTVTDPTADRTITLPNLSGDVMLWQNEWGGDPNGPADDSSGQNIPIGQNALSSLTTTSTGFDAFGNIGIGLEAGKEVTTGAQNVLVGRYAGAALTTGDLNVAIGVGPLGSVSSGTAIGHTTSQQNIAIGTAALRPTSSGTFSGADNNVVIGREAGRVIQTSDNNVCIGRLADVNYSNAITNTAIGMQSRCSYQQGVAVGYRAGYSQFGQSDAMTLVGSYAGYDMDGGDYCTYVGWQTGYGGGSGISNTGVGIQSLFGITSGAQNVGCARAALRSLTSGDNNTALGSGAGYNMTTPDNNTFVGREAGYNVTTGSNLTVLGANADPSSNTATNEVTLGDTNVTSLRCNVQTISSLSDERDKTAIQDLPYGLEFINDMRPVQFTWNRRDGSLGATKDIGFIAQDLYEVELDHSSTTRTRLVSWDNPDKLEADYVRSYPILVKAVQQLSAKIDALTTRVAELEGE